MAQNAPRSARAGLQTQTFKAALQEAIEAFQQGEYARAASLFDALSEVFSQADQFLELRSTLLPIWAYSALQAGDFETAIRVFERYLADFADEGAWRSFAIFSLARAYEEAGRFEPAIENYERFMRAYPRRPEALVSALRQAELFFAEGRDTEGLDRLEGFSESELVPPALQAEARLRALRRAVELGEHERAAELLLERRWSITEMPELAVLTFSALKVGEQRLRAGDAKEALQALRIVTPRDILMHLQAQRLAELREALNRQAEAAARGGGPEATLWRDHLRTVVARVEAQRKALTESSDYTPGFHLRLGEAFLRLGRNRSAWVLFRELAEDDSLNRTDRASAHFRWILAANALDDWEAMRRIATVFRERYPDHPHVPQALFLAAYAHQQEEEYAAAVALLTQLLENYPDDRLTPRARFSRGLNATFDDAFAAARQDFKTYLANHPDGPQADLAHLWHALTFFFDREYATALRELEAAREAVGPKSPVVPEIAYRRAGTLYAMRDYSAALAATDDFLKDYESHQRAPEARVLRGDILMGQGELLEAATQFARVKPEAGTLFTYAVFQRGKILKALEQYELMARHFLDYVERDEVEAKIRLAEALYWVGWAYQHLGRTGEAFPVFISALSEHGHDPEAGETTGILQALERIVSGTADVDAVLPEGAPEGARELLEAESFSDWLDGQIAAAIADEDWTWFGRLQVYQAQRARRANNAAAENLALLAIVNQAPVEALDAESLAAVGDHLREQGLGGAEAYYSRIETHFEDSHHLGAAL
ncbi:MAG: tol-pal system YbgF family protein, partial [Opitutales bacterium]